ncbi:hypothetical protein HK104_004849, partial [Borealophlyctis nickersoniae]
MPTPYGTWWSRLHARLIDLVGDYAGRELFVVDGDSMLKHCLNDPNLDFPGYSQNKGEPGSGLQLAHIILNIEKFLSDLIVRRCNFHVAFFDDHVGVGDCVQDGVDGVYGRFLRNVVVHHLQKCSERVELTSTKAKLRVLEFTGLKDRKWEEYLAKEKPYFVMCSDGGLSTNNRVSPYHEFILAMMTRNISIALLDEVWFQDSKVVLYVITFVLENSSMAIAALRRFDEDSSAGSEDEDSNPDDGSDFEDSEATPSLDVNSLIQRAKQELGSETGARDLLTVCASAMYIHRIAQEKETSDYRNWAAIDLVKIFQVHVALLDALPLPLRAQPALQHYRVPDKDVHRVASEFLPMLLEQGAEVVEKLPKEDRESNLWDCIDGRLFWRLLFELSGRGMAELAQFLPKQVWEKVLRMWTATSKLCDLKLDGRPIPKVIAEPVAPSTTAKETYHLLPFDLAPINPHIPALDLPMERGTSSANTCGPNGIQHRERRHWHSKALITPKQKDRKLTPWQESRRLRSEAIYMKRMELYAQSLTGANGRELKRVTITHVAERDGGKKGKKVANEPVDSAKSGKKGGKGKPSKGGGAAAKIIADNIAAKAKKTEAKSLTQWKEDLARLEKAHDKLEIIDRILTKGETSNSTDSYVLLEIRAYKLLYLVNQIDASSPEETRVPAFRLAISIFYYDKLTKDIYTLIRDCLTALG